MAAIGGAAVVCLLAVPGALGVSPTGGSATDGHDAAQQTANRTSTSTSSSYSTSSPTRSLANGSSTPTGHRPAGSAAAEKHASSAVLPGNAGTGRRVVFDMSRQRVWLVAGGGTVARTYPVSGSRYDNLRAGTYSVFSRDVRATAYNSNETMRYMVRFAYGRAAPIGFHSIPALANGALVETRSQLGTPRSDGCIRQWITDARALWTFAPVGTTVVVLA
ncbi:MAG: L,D-transpeptidase [Nocardioidaceae bacterium]